MAEGFGPKEFAARFNVSRETIDRLTLYEALLVKWQKTINLVAPSTLPKIWSRHFADSAQLLPLAHAHLTETAKSEAEAASWLDLGSGAGFPGLVCAVLLADESLRGRSWRVTLVESDTRKAAFLAEVVRKLALPGGKLVEILPRRVEFLTTHTSLQPVDILSARALSPLEGLLDLALPLFGAQTVGLFLKGRDAAAEIIEAEKRYVFACKQVPSQTDPDGSVLRVSNVRIAQRGG